MYTTTNKLFYFCKNSRNIFFIIFLILIQGCTSSIEVAANLGKKYLIPKEEKKRIQKPIYKIGKKYNVGGKYYYPKKDLYYNKTGIASWYGPKFHGKLTANGEIFDQYDITAAHKTLPLPSMLRVTNLENGRQIMVRVNDRGPFVRGRIIDLSYKAARKLDFVHQGTVKVRIDVIRLGDNKYYK